MKTRYICLAVLFIFCSSRGFSVSADTIYFNSKNEETAKEWAKGYKIVNKHPYFGNFVWVEIYDKQGNLCSTGSFHSSACLIKELVYSTFYENGLLKSEIEYQNGRKSGLSKQWWENGKLREEGHYENGERIGLLKRWYETGLKRSERFYDPDAFQTHRNVKVLNFWSVAGEHQVINGEGSARYIYRNTDMTFATGSYEKGYKVGLWKGYYITGDQWYEEDYKGKKLKGTSWNKNGRSYSYNKLETEALPKTDMKSFFESTQKSVNYPKEAKIANVEGKVYVKFIIDEFGKITQIEAKKSIGYGCEQAAEDAVSVQSDWRPATKRGIPVEAQKGIMLKFKKD